MGCIRREQVQYDIIRLEKIEHLQSDVRFMAIHEQDYGLFNLLFIDPFDEGIGCW